ncbi:hypothetical protein UFOVP275_5 [uncultured Caudovirales phage]|uniref:Uncharacterized protein n=1 Tax=uncultured Caudovirales phage TaxID=2100421 RepID=A0A6J5LSM3_9CAUD|nr:hypothetical protein UFOVP275_5 [uncultured Caudovirales phage]
MLTKEQSLSLAKQHGMSCGVTILPDSPLFNNTQNLVDFANTLYAAGAKDMQERCARVCRDVEAENTVPPLIDFEASECERRILALETT